jgi:hypothetical protein
MKVFNALLAVRPDHSEKAKPFDYKSPTGETLRIFDGSVNRTIASSGVVESELHIALSFGGHEGLKSIAYIALTFFAQYFPEPARSVELRPVKDFLLSNNHNDFAWWLDSETPNDIPINPFEFGHTISVLTSSITNEATGFVSLFGILNFGVRLGTISGLKDKTVVVFINPLAESAPSDIQKFEFEKVIIQIQKPEPLQAHLIIMVKERSGERKFQELANKIERWKFRNDMEPYVRRLNSVRLQPPNAFSNEVKNVVEENTNRVYRLMLYVADKFEKIQEFTSEKVLVSKLLNFSVETDPSTQSGLTSFATERVSSVMIALIGEISSRLNKGELDTEYLFQIFSSNIGAAIAAKVMTEITINEFEATV